MSRSNFECNYKFIILFKNQKILDQQENDRQRVGAEIILESYFFESQSHFFLAPSFVLVIFLKNQYCRVSNPIAAKFQNLKEDQYIQKLFFMSKNFFSTFSKKILDYQSICRKINKKSPESIGIIRRIYSYHCVNIKSTLK